MMSLDEEKKSMRDAYWRERDKADGLDVDEPEAPKEMRLAEMDFSGDTPKEDVAESPEGVPDFNTPEVPLSSAPMVSAQTPDAARAENQRKRLAALQEASRLASSPLDVPGNDAEIAQAQASDKAQRGRDAITEAIQGWLMRKPAKAPAPQDAEDLIKRRQLAEGSAFKQRQQQLSVQEQLAKALMGEKSKEMSPYEQALINRWNSQDAKNAERAGALNQHTQNADQLARDRFEWEKTHPKKPLAPSVAPVIAKAGDFSTVPEGDRSMVQAIVNGNTKIPSSMSKEGGRIRKLVFQVAPNFDETLYPAYAATRKAFTSGIESKGINSFNTALEHMAELEHLMPNNTASPFWNGVQNYAKTGTGSPEVTKFMAARQAVVDELAKAYSGKAASDTEIAHWKHLLSESASPEQMVGNFKVFKDLLAGKLRAYETQWQSAMPNGAVPPLKIISDRARKVMESTGYADGGEAGGTLNTRKTKSGATAYQGRKTGKWFDNAEEAEAN